MEGEGSRSRKLSRRGRSRMRGSVYAALLLGLGVFTALIAWHGVVEVASALAVAGWGLLLVAVYHLVPMVADAFAWRTLFGRPQPSFGRMLWGRWISDAVNSMLPVAQLGGDVVRARVLRTIGIPGRVSGATVVVDLTLAALTEMAFASAGVALLLYHLGRKDVAAAILLGVGAFALLLWVFYLLQRRGLFGALARRLTRIPGGRGWLSMVGGADGLDSEIADIYGRPRAVFHSAVWNFLSWVLGTGEVWLAMYFLGMPVTLTEAVLLESLGQGLRHAAFIVPGGLGVQEGTYVFLGALLGIPAQVALALSLAKRARELIFGIPGLLAWHYAEGVQLRRARAMQRPRRRDRVEQSHEPRLM